MNKLLDPVVPDQLQSFLTPDFLDIHDHWAQKKWDEFRTEIPEPTTISAGGRYTKAVLLPGDPEAGVNIIMQQHQQSWKPSMALIAMYHKSINNPDGLTVVLPNNSTEASYYSLTTEELGALHVATMRPLYELHTRTLEAVQRRVGNFGKTAILGNSLGGLTALGIASVASPELDIAEIVSVEAPNANRTTKELSKDFFKSGGIVGQHKAIRDASLPLLSYIQRPHRLARDYMRFGLASRMPENRAILEGMAQPSFPVLVRNVLLQNADINVRLGWVEGSFVFDPSVLENMEMSLLTDPTDITKEFYSGNGAHAHATVDNPVAVAGILRTNA